jgi:hypothetical protein
MGGVPAGTRPVRGNLDNFFAEGPGGNFLNGTLGIVRENADAWTFFDYFEPRTPQQLKTDLGFGSADRMFRANPGTRGFVFGMNKAVTRIGFLGKLTRVNDVFDVTEAYQREGREGAGWKIAEIAAGDVAGKYAGAYCAASGAAFGAGTGAAFFGIGAVPGALIGGVVGYLGCGYAAEKLAEGGVRWLRRPYNPLEGLQVPRSAFTNRPPLIGPSSVK